MSNYWNDEERLKRAAGIHTSLTSPQPQVTEAPEVNTDDLDDDAYLDQRIQDMDAARGKVTVSQKKIKNEMVGLGFDADDLFVDIDDDRVRVKIDVGVDGLPLEMLAKIHAKFGKVRVAPYDSANIEVIFMFPKDLPA